MRRFVVIGQRATASPIFRLEDIPGTSGRLDVALRCLRAALLVSHGLRRDTVVYLVLLGGPDAPRAIRVDGAAAKYIRPDERSLGVTVKKVLAAPLPDAASGFVEIRPGIALARSGLDAVLHDLGTATLYVLDEHGADVRETVLDLQSPTFFVGDHLGFDETTKQRLAELGARSIGVGPVSLHAEDAIAVVSNEMDRRSGG
jgi:tRNA (pseudouridine54-N1)-methyltransferase